jgi:hypothetical protein
MLCRSFGRAAEYETRRWQGGAAGKASLPEEELPMEDFGTIARWLSLAQLDKSTEENAMAAREAILGIMRF